MTNEEWDTVALLLSKGWKGEFGPGEDRAYRLLLESYSGQQVVAALRQLAATGHHAVPSVSEIVQMVERDPERLTTFEEMFDALYGSGRVLAARSKPGAFEDYGAMLQSQDRAASDAAWNLDPLLGKFVDTYGVRNLKLLEVRHDEHAGLVRKDLREAWERFVQTNAHRDAAALAAGRRRSLERKTARKLDAAETARQLGVESS